MLIFKMLFFMRFFSQEMCFKIMRVQCESHKAVYLDVKYQSAYCNMLEVHNLQLKLYYDLSTLAVLGK